MKRFILIAAVFGLTHCGSTTTSATDTTTTGLRFNTVADFTNSASASLAKALGKTTTAQCADVADSSTQDEPTLADGLDCDNDDGLVAHVTPSQYAVAFKRVTLVAASGGTNIDLIADTTTLANAEVVNFTSADTSETIITLDPNDLTAGTYTGIEAEIYYIQMTFPVGGTTRNVRIYMSDDDFTAEGSLGHHQGDITFVTDAGVEQGWVDSTWSDTLATTRGEPQNGAGGEDAQTGHDRGFFGNAEFWNATDLQQGATQDLYLLALDFDASLTIPTPASITDLTTVSATFSTADTFFYEDFAPQGTGFSPDSGGEATGEGAAWAPLAPTASVTVTTGS